MKILILKPSSLGDVVQALPVLRLIKRHLPASEIYWWIDSSLAPLLEGDPDLAGVVRFERRRWASPSHWREIWRSVRWMRQQNFDWVIDLQCLMRSGVFAWLANGKLSVGLDEPREGARGFYDLIVQRPSPLTHAVDWYLRVLPVAGRAGAWGFPMAAGAPRRGRIGATRSGRWTGRGGLSFSPARAGRTNAGRPNLTPNWCGCWRRQTPDSVSPFLAARKIAPWARSSRGLTRRGAWI